MLSVGNRDGRKGLGFGGEMDDTELEEGEACSYQDDDMAVDPDIALAYLDEKLQNVLGHFQKEFEGGVSAENLGAKFGGYGSFLPTYQRSPLCSHTRMPIVQNHALRSPNNLQLEGGFNNITTAASASLPALSSDISNTRTLSATKHLTTRDPLKHDANMDQIQTEELTSRAKTPKKSMAPDQKKLRVRIRVGSDNLSTQTKAELYSGLGLVASPTSSFEDSPESEGWCSEHQNAPDESPNSIINIMTSRLLEGTRVLSPLNNDLTHLIGSKKGRTYSASRNETRKSLDFAKGLASLNHGKSLVSVNKNASTINDKSLELNNGGTKDAPNIISKIAKEVGDETSACDEMISNALKLPLLSISDGTAGDLPKSNVSGVYSVRNLLDDHPEDAVGDDEARLRKSIISRNGKNYESTCSKLKPSKVIKPAGQEQNICNTLKAGLRDGYQESEVFRSKGLSSSNLKSNSKATMGHNITAEVVKAGARDGSSSRSKLEKSKKSKGSKCWVEKTKSQNHVRKSRDTYNDIFGVLDHEEKELQSLENSSGCRTKDSQVTDIGKITLKNKMKEETVSKKIDMSVISESHPKPGSHVAPLVGLELTEAPAPAAPVLIKEHWVCCDNCQKWRLLPVGRLPETLPEKWLCSMLDWLPGMNSCDIEEEETTKALVSFYQASIPESGKSSVGHIGGSTYGAFPSGQTENFQSAVKCKSLNDVNHSPAVTNLDNPHLRKSSDMAVEKSKKLSKNAQKLHEHSLNRGGMTSVKMNKKKRPGHDSPRIFKKHKNEDPTDERSLSQSDRQLASKKGGPTARSISPFIVTRSDHIEHMEDIQYKNHTCEEINNSKTSKKSNAQVSRSVDRSFGNGKDGTKYSSTRKRKANGKQEHIQSESFPSEGLKDEEAGSLKEDSSQRFSSKEKKARLSSHLCGPDKENNFERGYQAVPNDLTRVQDPASISVKGSMENTEPSWRNLAPSISFTEATSSSSKISSSRKRKANLQDNKGSPVESVSSLPLRSRRNARHASNDSCALEKDCSPNVIGLSVSSRRYSDHEVDGRKCSAGLVLTDDGWKGEDSVFPHKGNKFSKGKSVASGDFPNKGTLTKVANSFDKYPLEEQISDVACNNSHRLLNVSLSDKEEPSMRSKDRIWKLKPGSDKSDASNLIDSSQDQTHIHGNKVMDITVGEHTAAEPLKLDRKHNIKTQNGDSGERMQVKSRTDGLCHGKHDIFPSASASQKILVEKHAGTPKEFPSKNMELLETSPLTGKPDVRSPFVGGISAGNGNTFYCPESHQGKEINITNQNGVMETMLKHPTPAGHTSKDHNACSPAQRDSSSQSASNAVKEGKSLKHVADRLKSSGSNAESIGLYFQAALKFLLGASLLESSTSETRHGDIIQSTQMYSSTAKLCEFCAREFEKAQDMASAALAYKCTEVAYMRVVYSSHSNANRDRHELQTTLQMAPPGESPSSSASDVDNVNNAATGEKLLLAKGVSSPQLAGSHVIPSRSRPSFSRLLNFAQDVSFAMEASRKSQITLAAASAYLEKVQNVDGIILIKRALDYNFQDVEGLLQLVRLGVEQISR